MLNYLNSIMSALVIFPFLAIFLLFPVTLFEYHKYGSLNIIRILFIYSFILYLIIIYFLVILPLPQKETVIYNPHMINLIPFSFIKDFKKESSLVLNNPSTYLKALREPCFYTVFFNILLTIPLGMYLKGYFKCCLGKTFLLSLTLSLFLELTQASGLYGLYPYPYRVFDVDDLIMNTLGGLIGYYLMQFISNFKIGKKT